MLFRAILESLCEQLQLPDFSQTATTPQAPLVQHSHAAAPRLSGTNKDLLVAMRMPHHPRHRARTSFAEGAICGVRGDGQMTCGVPVATDAVTGAPMIIEFAHVQSQQEQAGCANSAAGDNKAITQGLAQLLETVNSAP
ncbi:unnamed protein product [Amoebophrya sp. A120]|nr:unnamed protein product [Amoebophrya sp. A120]|eukprot:GSA120T00020843001.1